MSWSAWPGLRAQWTWLSNSGRLAGAFLAPEPVSSPAEGGRRKPLSRKTLRPQLSCRPQLLATLTCGKPQAAVREAAGCQARAPQGQAAGGGHMCLGRSSEITRRSRGEKSTLCKRQMN